VSVAPASLRVAFLEFQSFLVALRLFRRAHLVEIPLVVGAVERLVEEPGEFTGGFLPGANFSRGGAEPRRLARLTYGRRFQSPVVGQPARECFTGVRSSFASLVRGTQARKPPGFRSI
jgi:hypothetical protein